METAILKKAYHFVKTELENNLSEKIVYHDFEHTIFVRNECLRLAKEKKMNGAELEILLLSALFHDIGFVKQYQGHENASKEIARQFLENENYADSSINRIISCIEATKLVSVPTGDLESMLKDADLCNVGHEDFVVLMNNLRAEWDKYLGNSFSDLEWIETEIKFFKSHQFFTQEAQNLYGKQKQKNLKFLKKEKKKLKKEKDSTVQGIAKSKTAQMMFKTALRNHIDLTNLADNKANIMLSIAAVIITVSIPLLPRQLEDNVFFAIPGGILLITCIIVIILGTLVTRPIKMKGITNIKNIKEGTSNLFFFGNFYGMTNQEYHEAMKEVIDDSDLLDKSVINDLYYLGEALGGKYNLLRTCYLVFMIGMTLTVVAFGLTYAFTCI